MMSNKPHAFRTGVATLVMMGAAIAVIIGSGIPGGGLHLSMPWQSSMTLKAQLRSSDILEPNAAVDVAGVKVGTVQSIGSDGNYAVVTMRIDQASQAALKTDAAVALRTHGLLGGEYIELTPGHARQPLADGATISVDKSQQPVDLDQVLNALQAPEAANLRTTLVELGVASEGRGSDLNNLLAVSRTLTQNLKSPVQAVAAVAPQLGDVLVQSEAFNSDFAQTPLDQLVANSNVTLQALAANSAHLQNVLSNADTDLSQLNSDLSGQQGNLRTILGQLGDPSGVLSKLQTFDSSIGLFSRNLQGQDPSMPQDQNVTSGIIAAIENPKSAFSSYDCTVQQSPCPPADRDYYLRVQIFNLAGSGNLPSTTQLPLCSLNILNLPGTPKLTDCQSGAPAAYGSAGPLMQSLSAYLAA
jgi:virulence factor Mce-like protein